MKSKAEKTVKLYLRRCPGCNKVFGVKEESNKYKHVLPDIERRQECDCDWDGPGTMWYEQMGVKDVLVVFDEKNGQKDGQEAA